MCALGKMYIYIYVYINWFLVRNENNLYLFPGDNHVFIYLVSHLKNNKLIFLFLEVTNLCSHILKWVHSLTPLSPSSSKFFVTEFIEILDAIACMAHHYYVYH